MGVGTSFREEKHERERERERERDHRLLSREGDLA